MRAKTADALRSFKVPPELVKAPIAPIPEIL